MTTNQIMIRLEEITIGHTTTINGIAVTRWNDNQWEAGTFNKDRMDIQQTVNKIIFIEISELIS